MEAVNGHSGKSTWMRILRCSSEINFGTEPPAPGQRGPYQPKTKTMFYKDRRGLELMKKWTEAHVFK